MNSINEIMRYCLTLAAIAMMAGKVQGGQTLGAYNLLPSHFLVPQTYNTLQLPSGGAIPGIISAPQQETDISHPAVVENAIAESQLPSELLNPFYKNPGIASALAKESWFTNKEFLVRHREAEKIPRQEIYKIISRLQNRRR
ncbi:hypothetical protein NQ314_015028 [Rhamnusium bicolor]|uniref:Uncharacterized protein n=1 Tax=Rhamnusium bicolor TaxID=1586634 RepID=A0AAV8WZT4_9CUCU|nr:hypothetical protein NQ314_015028 [Rhamnusium bicolor]